MLHNSKSVLIVPFEIEKISIIICHIQITSIINRDQNELDSKAGEYAQQKGQQSNRRKKPKIATSATKKLSAAVKAFLSSAAARNTKDTGGTKTKKGSTTVTTDSPGIDSCCQADLTQKGVSTVETSKDNQTKIRQRNPLLTSLVSSSLIPACSAVKMPPSLTAINKSKSSTPSTKVLVSPAPVNSWKATTSSTPLSPASVNPSRTTTSSTKILSPPAPVNSSTVTTSSTPSLSASVNSSTTTMSSTKMPPSPALVNLIRETTSPAADRVTQNKMTLKDTLTTNRVAAESKRDDEGKSASEPCNIASHKVSSSRQQVCQSGSHPTLASVINKHLNQSESSDVKNARTKAATKDASKTTVNQPEPETKPYLGSATVSVAHTTQESVDTKFSSEPPILKSKGNILATSDSSSNRSKSVSTKSETTSTASNVPSSVNEDAGNNGKQPVMTLYLKKSSAGQLVLTQAVPHVKCSPEFETKQPFVKMLTGGSNIPLNISGTTLENTPVQTKGFANSPPQRMSMSRPTNARSPGASQPARYHCPILGTNAFNNSPLTASSQTLPHALNRSTTISSTGLQLGRLKEPLQGSLSVGQQYVVSRKPAATTWTSPSSSLNPGYASRVRHTIPMGSTAAPQPPIPGMMQQCANGSKRMINGMSQNEIEACKIWSRYVMFFMPFSYF